MRRRGFTDVLLTAGCQFTRSNEASSTFDLAILKPIFVAFTNEIIFSNRALAE